MRFVYVAASALSLAALFPNVGSAQGLQFIPVTPCRVVDTRNPNGAFGGPEMTAGSTRTFNVPSSSCGIPSSAAAYALNVTVVPDAQLGFLTIWPAGQNQPLASTLNSDGRVKANAAIVPAGSAGGINVFVTDQTHVIIDINGYFVPDGTPAALQFFPVTPCRIADTRSPNGPLGGPFIQAGNARPFSILSSNCNIPGGASAFSLNFTAVPHGPLGFITVWPSDQNQPLASTLNASTGAITANAAIVPGATGSGQVSVFASNDTDLVIDINGYFAPPAPNGLDLFNLSPCRVLDTRNNGGQPFNGSIPVNVLGSGCGAQGNAQAFVLNATVVPPGPLGFLTLWPDGQQQPFVSTLNAPDAVITSNMAIVPTTNGSIDAFGSDPTHLILDISGYFAPNSPPPPPPCGGPPCVFIDSVSLGNNLQTLVNVNLSPAPAVNTIVTVFTNNPALVTVAGRSGEIGSSSVTYTQPAGTTTTGVYVQALASSGSVPIFATATGYGSSPGTVALFPSGFVLSSSSGNPFTVGEFGSAQLSVSSYRLDGSGNPVAIQQIRAGQSPTVSVNIGDPSKGSVSPSSLTFPGGSDTMATQFTAGNNDGQTTISVSEPSGFIAPANNSNQVQVNVAPIGLNCTSNVGVAFNLATQGMCAISNNGGAPTDEVITLTSTNPGALLLTPNLLTPAAASITTTIRQGTSNSAPFYLVGAGNSGTASYTASSGLGNTTSTVTLLRSGFALSVSGSPGGNFGATFPGSDVLINVQAESLDASGNPLLSLPLAPGVTASVNVFSSNQNVGTVVGSPATITGGNASTTVTFHPTGAGVANISASAASPGYTTPASGASVGAIVGTPNILVTAPAVPIGQNLQIPTSVFLGAAPPSNLTLTLSAAGQIKLSANGTDAGSTTLNLTLPAGQQSAVFYIYGLASSGTATITASASGYNPGTATVTLDPSGFVISGPFGAAPVFQTSQGAGAQTLSIQPAVLDSSNNYIATESLAGSRGAVAVAISNSNSAAGSVPTSVNVPVNGTGTVMFTPAQNSSGQQTDVTLGQPSGFNPPAPGFSTPGGKLTIVVQ